MTTSRHPATIGPVPDGGRRGPRAAVLLAMVAAMLLPPLGGCGSGRRGVELVRVAGRITSAGGPMPGAGKLAFVPRSADRGTVARPLRPAIADFGVDGGFTATSWTPGDGLVPGTYAVVVDCWEVPPIMGGPPPRSFIDAAYGSAATTPLEVVVPPGSRPLTISLDVARPR